MWRPKRWGFAQERVFWVLKRYDATFYRIAPVKRPKTFYVWEILVKTKHSNNFRTVKSRHKVVSVVDQQEASIRQSERCSHFSWRSLSTRNALSPISTIQSKNVNNSETGDARDRRNWIIWHEITVGPSTEYTASALWYLLAVEIEFKRIFTT